MELAYEIRTNPIKRVLRKWGTEQISFEEQKESEKV